jgi:hypothetical protein
LKLAFSVIPKHQLAAWVGPAGFVGEEIGKGVLDAGQIHNNALSFQNGVDV